MAFFAATAAESLAGLLVVLLAAGSSGVSSASKPAQAVSSMAATAQMVNSDVLKVPKSSFFQFITFFLFSRHSAHVFICSTPA